MSLNIVSSTSSDGSDADILAALRKHIAATDKDLPVAEGDEIRLTDAAVAGQLSIYRRPDDPAYRPIGIVRSVNRMGLAECVFMTGSGLPVHATLTFAQMEKA